MVTLFDSATLYYYAPGSCGVTLPILFQIAIALAVLAPVQLGNILDLHVSVLQTFLSGHFKSVEASRNYFEAYTSPESVRCFANVL